MPTVLLTGANGFTGRYLATSLREAGHIVFGLEKSGGDSCPEAIVCDLGDRTNLIAVVQNLQPDIVIHLAAISFVAFEDVDAIYRTNIVGTRNLLEALAQCAHKPQAVLLASSAIWLRRRSKWCKARSGTCISRGCIAVPW